MNHTNQRFKGLLLSRDSIILLFILIAVDILLLTLAAFAYYPRVVNVDGLYTAQVSRNILAGNGYKTGELTLYEVNLYLQKGWLASGPPWNNAGRFPLPALVRTLLFLALGDSYFVATYLYSMSFHALSVALVFVIGLYLFKERSVAFFSSLLFAANPLMIFSGINGKETTSDYALFLVSLGFVYWLMNRTRLKATHLFVLGVVLGITFLNRFNLGGVMILSIIPLFVRKLRKEKALLSRNLKVVSALLSGFLMTVGPFVGFNTLIFGSPLFSSNVFFQVVAFSRPAKFMNPWWKLSYPFDVSNPISALLLFPQDLIQRTLSSMASSLFDFTSIAIPGAGYAWFWWIPIGVSAFAVRRLRFSDRPVFPSTSQEQVRAAGFVWYFVLFHFIVGLPLLASLTGGAEYFWYLYSAMAMLAGFGLTRILIAMKQGSAPIMDGFRFWRLSRKFHWPLSGRQIGKALAGGFSLALLVALWQGPARSGMVSLQIALSVLGLLGIFALVSKAGRTTISALLILLILIIPVVRFGIVGASGSPEVVPDWITEQDSQIMGIISSLTASNEIVVSAQPWNVVWWAQRPSIPFSEFPDEIFLLITTYKLNIRAVYIANLNSVFYRDIHAPYTYDAYRRIAINNYTLAGFVPVRQGSSSNGSWILLLRDGTVDPTTLLRTKGIDFGKSDEASHLVWGWAQDINEDSTTATWAIRPGGPHLDLQPRFDFSPCSSESEVVHGRCLPNLSYSSSGRTTVVGAPDSELTFLSDDEAGRTLQFRVKSPVPNQSMLVLLNSNLLFFGQPGSFLGNYTITLADTWINLNVTVAPGLVHKGLNLLTFIFAKSLNYSSPGGLEERLLLFDELTITP